MSASMIWKGLLGVPYQGSKNAIARDIIAVLPRGKRFVDLFAGGCAMTHAAMISGKYDTFLANDLTFESRGVYHDTSSKGDGKRHDLWRACAIINGQRVRKRFRDKEQAKRWLRNKCV